MPKFKVTTGKELERRLEQIRRRRDSFIEFVIAVAESGDGYATSSARIKDNAR